MNDPHHRLVRHWFKKHGMTAGAVRPPRRIGIYAGAFDPVHAGHIGFALQALAAAELDEVVFMPERMPPGKPGVEHYAHRTAMLDRALRPHPRLSVLEMVDRRYSVTRTLPQLEALFPGDRLVFLVGSDVARSLPDWQYAGRLLRRSELVVGVRGASSRSDTERRIAGWEVQPAGLTVVTSFAPDISSTAIRQALRSNGSADGLLSSVRRYARQQWLYASVHP